MTLRSRLGHDTPPQEAAPGLRARIIARRILGSDFAITDRFAEALERADADVAAGRYPTFIDALRAALAEPR